MLLRLINLDQPELPHATAAKGGVDLAAVQPCIDSKPTIGANPDNSPGWPAANP
jgi:hypothetical protein